jgi:1,4-dihydroxy-2-naphthoate octaprenyltransferase
MVMGTYLAVTGSWSWHAFYASLPVALLIALVLYVNQVPDRIGDAAAGKRTVVVRLPRETIVGGYAIVAATAFVLIAAGGASGYLPQWTLLALLPAPLAVRVWRGLRRWYDDPYALMPVMQVNIGLHLATGVLLVAGYLVAVLAR